MGIVGRIKQTIFERFKRLGSISPMDIKWNKRIKFENNQELIQLVDSFKLDLKSKSDLITNLENKNLYLILYNKIY